jgi:hypothetical protein
VHRRSDRRFLIVHNRVCVHRANILLEQGHVVQAEPLWRQALDIFSKANETHPATSAVHLKFVALSMERGDIDGAM